MDNNVSLHLQQDPVLRPLLDSIVIQPSSESKGVYQDLLGSIISQQLSGKVAGIIHERFLKLFPENTPEPNALIKLEVDKLKGAGLSGQKALYLKNVAEFFIDENLLSKNFNEMQDDEIIDLLTRIKGVGKWTVEMILMFTLKRPDVFPVDDLGIRTAMVDLYNIDCSGKELRLHLSEISKKWSPYRSHACFYLWRYKDGK